MNRYGNAKVLLLYEPLWTKNDGKCTDEPITLRQWCYATFENAGKNPYAVRVGEITKNRPHIIQPDKAAVLLIDLSQYSADERKEDGTLPTLINEMSTEAPAVPIGLVGLQYRFHRPLDWAVREEMKKRGHPNDRMFLPRLGPDVEEYIWDAFDNHDNGQRYFPVFAWSTQDFSTFPHYGGQLFLELERPKQRAGDTKIPPHYERTTTQAKTSYRMDEQPVFTQRPLFSGI